MVDIRRKSKRNMVKERFLNWAAEHKVCDGDQVLSQNELASAAGVSPLTAFKALAELEEEGIVHRVKGRGTFWGPREARPATRSACLILPGVGVDQPAHNPDYYLAVQNLMSAFFQAAGETWKATVETVPLAEDALPDPVSYAQYGCVFFHHTRQPQALLEALVAKRVVPVAVIGSADRSLACLSVEHDRREGVRTGVRYLASRGYRRIAYLGTEEWWGELSHEGYLAGLADAGLEADPALHVRVPSLPPNARQGARTLLEAGRPFDAVFVDQDLRAVWALEEFRDAGLRVPDELGVMGYEGISAVVDYPPCLTSVRIPYPEMIRSALGVFEAAGAAADAARNIVFYGTVHEGRTTR